jgi:hypothetical protein
MKTKTQVKERLDYFESFGKDGRYSMDTLDKCMGAIALKKVMDNYESEEQVREYIESEMKKNSDIFNKNKGNLRGFSDALEIKHFFWVLDAKTDDYFDENDAYRKK